MILHYSCSKCPCRFKHFWGHLDSSNYLGPHCSVMNKVFCTSKVRTRWAFKVALHWTCVLLLVHERAEHSCNLSQVGNPGWASMDDGNETRALLSTHTCSSFVSFIFFENLRVIVLSDLLAAFESKGAIDIRKKRDEGGKRQGFLFPSSLHHQSSFTMSTFQATSAPSAKASAEGKKSLVLWGSGHLSPHLPA